MVSGTTREDLSLPYLASPLGSSELMLLEERRLELRGRIKLAETSSLQSRHLVELFFNEERSNARPYAGTLVMQTRAYLDESKNSQVLGGALQPYYPCPDEKCPGFIHPDLVSPTLGVTVCPKCQKQWPVTALSGERFFKLYVQHWAYVAARVLIRMNLNADLKLVYTPASLTKVTREHLSMGKMSRGEGIRALRASRQNVIYPLRRLLEDLTEGVTLESRVRAFLEA